MPITICKASPDEMCEAVIRDKEGQPLPCERVANHVVRLSNGYAFFVCGTHSRMAKKRYENLLGPGDKRFAAMIESWKFFQGWL